MVTDAATVTPTPEPLPQPRIVDFGAPWSWLAAGWQDLWAHPRIGLSYGFAFAALAALLSFGLYTMNALPLFLALAGGFLLLGPMVAVGLYRASSIRAHGGLPTLATVMVPPRHALGQLAFAGAFLLVIYFLWLRAAFLIFMLFIGTTAIPPLSAFTQLLLFTPNGLGLLVVGTAVGAVLALFVFATTALAVPMLVDRRVDIFTAAAASVRAVQVNPKSMMLWAALIVVMVAAGLITLLIGLVITLPLIGHATWHAYQDIYGQAAPPRRGED